MLAANISQINIYIDRSGINNKIEAAAWSIVFGARCLYLGHLDKYTVYFAEVITIDLDLIQILKYN